MSYCSNCDKDLSVCLVCNKELKSQFLCLVLNKNVKFNGFHFCCMDCYDYFKKTLCEGVIVNR